MYFCRSWAQITSTESSRQSPINLQPQKFSYTYVMLDTTESSVFTSFSNPFNFFGQSIHIKTIPYLYFMQESGLFTMLDMSQCLFKLFNCILQHDVFSLESKEINLDFPISTRAGQFHHHTGLMDGVRVGHQQCLLHHICYSERSLLDFTISPSSQSKPSLFTIH